MFNKTSLNKVVVHNILKACNTAMSNESGQSYVNNRKGNPFIRVKKVKKKDGKTGFQVLDNANKNIGPMIGRVLVIDEGATAMCNNNPHNLMHFVNEYIAFPSQIA
jgi:hypothetical protein